MGKTRLRMDGGEHGCYGEEVRDGFLYFVVGWVTYYHLVFG